MPSLPPFVNPSVQFKKNFPPQCNFFCFIFFCPACRFPNPTPSPSKTNSLRKKFFFVSCKAPTRTAIYVRLTHAGGSPMPCKLKLPN
jgi:hypothetical protein